jgi:aspartate/methionine/tyrosine aminotransferase
VAGLPDVVENTHNPPIPEGVIEAAIQALNDGKTHYTDRPGILGLRQWVTDFLQKQYNVMLKPDAVTITCGGTEARFVAIKRLVKAEGVILCPGDSSLIAGAAHLVGTKIIHEIRDASAIKMIYATPQDSIETLKSLLEQAKNNGWWVVWDGSEKEPPPLSSPVNGGGSNTFHPAQDETLAPKVISIGSFSDVMPGWRVGWIAGSEMADKLRAYKQSMTICSTSISQWAGMGLTE